MYYAGDYYVRAGYGKTYYVIVSAYYYVVCTTYIRVQ